MENLLELITQKMLPKNELIAQLETSVPGEKINPVSEFAEVNEEIEKVFGNPEKDMESWHLQSENNSCAIACQEYVAEQLLNEDFSESEMIKYAERKGWYHPETGTSPSDVGNLLRELGLEVETGMQHTISDLQEELDTGGKIIVAVNNMILENPEYADLPGYSANHAVQVIGIDTTNAADVRVILNDPGVENGQGRSVSLSTFKKAWETGGNYAVIARKGTVA